MLKMIRIEPVEVQSRIEGLVLVDQGHRIRPKPLTLSELH